MIQDLHRKVFMIKPYKNTLLYGWGKLKRGKIPWLVAVFFASFLGNLLLKDFGKYPSWVESAYFGATVFFGAWLFLSTLVLGVRLRKILEEAPRISERLFWYNERHQTLNPPSWRHVLRVGYSPCFTRSQQHRARCWLKENKKSWQDEFYKQSSIQMAQSKKLQTLLPNLRPFSTFKQKNVVLVLDCWLSLVIAILVILAVSLHPLFWEALLLACLAVCLSTSSVALNAERGLREKYQKQRESYIKETLTTLQDAGLTLSDCVLLALDPSLNRKTRFDLMNFLNTQENFSWLIFKQDEARWSLHDDFLPLSLMKWSEERGEKPIISLEKVKETTPIIA